MTADHIILATDAEESRHGDAVSLVIQDRYAMWLVSHSNASRGTEDTVYAFQQFVRNDSDVKRLYSDGSREIASAARKLGWRHDVSTPNRPQTNGVAERAVKRVIEGTRSVLLASGLPHRFWSDASKCYCQLRNFNDIVKDGKTPHELRHGHAFPGLFIPFRSEDYKPSSFKETQEQLKFHERTRKGIFLGYRMHSGAYGAAIMLSL